MKAAALFDPDRLPGFRPPTPIAQLREPSVGRGGALLRIPQTSMKSPARPCLQIQPSDTGRRSTAYSSSTRSWTSRPEVMTQSSLEMLRTPRADLRSGKTFRPDHDTIP